MATRESALTTFVLTSTLGSVGFYLGYHGVDPQACTNTAVSIAAELSLTSLDDVPLVLGLNRSNTIGSSWVGRKTQELNRSIRKMAKEDEYHRFLMRWDHDNPAFQHKKIIRGVSGLIVGQAVLSLYQFATLRRR